MPFTVIIDTREKDRWDLPSSDILGVKFQPLKTGDYTIEGMEDLLCIERKANAAELAHNIHEKRFVRELERMTEFRFRYIILEAPLTHIMEYPSYEVPYIRNKVKLKGPYLIKCLNRMQVKYGINIIYASTKEYAAWVASNIMKEVFDLVNNENQAKAS